MSGSAKTANKIDLSLPGGGTSVAGDSAPDSFQIFIALAIFISATLTRLWFNFGYAHVDNTTSCDGFEYLTNAVNLQKFLGTAIGDKQFVANALAALTGHATTMQSLYVQQAFKPLADFAISGPAFPLFLATCYQLFGCPVTTTHCLMPVIIQCLLSAATASLLYAIGTKVWNRQVGILSGLLAVFYPAFIVNSGRLYPETFAAFLLVLTSFLSLPYLNKSNDASGFRAVALGFLLAFLQLTRSAMALLTIALIPITIWQTKANKRYLVTALLLSGFFIAMAPWLAFQKLAFGTCGLVVDRVGHYNFFIGNNVGSSGYLSIPYPDGHGIENRSFTDLAASAIKQSPSSWVKLMADKPARLFKFPWNDFRQSIEIPGGISGQVSEIASTIAANKWNIFAQVLFHQLIIFFALLGLTFSFAQKPQSSEDRKQLNSRLFLLALVALDCIYLFFITVPRYNLTAMPLIILFAACGLVTTFSKAKNRQAQYFLPVIAVWTFLIARLPFAEPWQLSLYASPWIYTTAVCLVKALSVVALVYCLWQALGREGTLAKILLVAITPLAAPSYCLPIASHAPIWQWQVELAPKSYLVRQINLSRQELAQVKSRQCYLLIDSGGAFALNNNVVITINGQKINSPLIPGLSFVDDQTSFKQDGAGHLYLEGGYIFSALTRGANRSNLDLRQWFFLPIDKAILNQLSDNQPLSIAIKQTGSNPTSFSGSYQLSKNSWTLPSVNLYSWEKAFYGVANDFDLTDTRYDTKIKAGADFDTTYIQSHSVQTIPGRLCLALFVPPKTESGNTFLSEIKTFNLGNFNVSSQAKTISLRDLPVTKANESWLVSLSGSYEKISGNLNPSIQLAMVGNKDGNRVAYSAPWMVDKLGQYTTGNGSAGNEYFSCAFPVAASYLPGLSTIDLTLNPTSPNLCNQVAKVSGGGSFKNLSVTIYRLPIVPTSAGWSIH
jgi:4-amino-4-deoxy-L-arabinose transferase-like glycosyltransferase